MDKPENSYAQVSLFAKRKEEEKFQNIVYVKYKVEEPVYLLAVMNSVFNKDNTDKHIYNVKQKVIATIYSLSFYFLIEWGWVATLQIKEFFSQAKIKNGILFRCTYNFENFYWEISTISRWKSTSARH